MEDVCLCGLVKARKGRGICQKTKGEMAFLALLRSAVRTSDERVFHRSAQCA